MYEGDIRIPGRGSWGNVPGEVVIEGLKLSGFNPP